jgi:hypothetical protein
MHTVTIIDHNNVLPIPAKTGETLLAVLQRSEVPYFLSLRWYK